MSSLFITVLNMSLTGAFVITTICIARLVLKKAPKIVSYSLWAVAGFRLVFPFSIESVFSLMPFDAQLISPYAAMQPMQYASESANPLQIWMALGLFAWLAGVAIMLFYGAISFVILKRKLKEASHIEANIFESEIIKTPFVLGIFFPKIYLPAYLTAQEHKFILLHEQIHIKRRDNIVKAFAYFILCLHWFNPAVWLGFLLMSMDMEMSCDECVLKEFGNEIKKGYSMTLLSLATERHTIGGSLLAFGDGNTDARIKNIVSLKKQSPLVLSIVMMLAFTLSMGLGVNRVSADIESTTLTQYEAFVFGQCCD